jgi:hypothetical protein
MKLTFKILTFVFLGLYSQNALAQLSGTKTIPGNYATLAAAITDLNTQGVNGALTITLSQNETAPAGGYVINTFTGASATNTVTIKGSTTAITLTAPVGTSTTTDAIIKLNGCDYVTIDGLTVQENVANTTATQWMEWGIAMVAPATTNGVQFCTIKNCSIALTRSYANTAIYARQHSATAVTVVAPTSAAGAHSNNTITNNTITNCLTAVLLHGHTAFPGQGNKVGNTVGTGNTITIGNNATSTTQPARGIVLSGQQLCVSSYNTISTATAPVHSNTVHGIYVGSTSFDGGIAGTYTINNNTLSLSTTTDVGRLFGIRMEAMASATVSANTIQNCSVSSATTGGADGISLASAINVTTSLAITNNIIQNNTLGSAVATTTGVMTLINLEGTSTANTVGTLTITGNQLINNTLYGATGAHRLIQVLHNANVAATVSNNIIRNITFNGTGIIYGINFQNQTFITPATTNIGFVNGNTIRNVKNTAATGTLEVLRAYTTTSSSMDINNNIITNCGYPTTSGTTNTTLRLISSSNSSANIINCNNNVLDTAFILGTNTATFNVLRGIQIDAFAFGKNINNNTISNIEMGVRSNSSSLSCGLRWGSGYNSIISGNNIRNVGSTVAGANLGMIAGISMGYPDDSVTVRNNFVSGIYAKNSTASANMHIIGIDIASGSSGLKVKMYNNTVYLTDAQNSGNGNNLFASGMRFGNPSNNVPTVDLRNNIVNVNVVPGVLGNTMALRRESGTAGVVPANFLAQSNNNIYYVLPVATCPSCYVYGENYGPITNGFTNDGNFNTACSGYQALFAPRESASKLENNLVAGGTAGTFAPTGSSFAESGGTAVAAVTTDFAGVTRSTPPDCGALQFAGTAITSGDVIAPAITMTNLGNSICTNANTLIATITDASGINTTAGTRPRLWYKKSTELDVLPATNTSADNGWKYVEAINTTSPFTFNFDYSLFNSPLAGGNIIQYFVVARDLNGNMGNSQISFPTSYCPSSPTLSAGAFPLSANLPVRTFSIINTPVNVTTAVTNQFVCNNSSTTFSLAGDLATGASYQWESAATPGGAFSSIAGATGFTYTPTLTLSSMTNYRCAVSCGGTPIITSTEIQVAVYPQLSGTYTIDKNAPISPTNFISFSAAAAALNCGITGPVVINVVANQTDFTDRFILNVISGASATNTITINGNGNKLKFNSLTLGTTIQFNEPYTMLFSGTDYVTLNDMIVEANDPSSVPYAMAVHLWNQADNNNFNNCTFISPQIANNNGQFVPFSISGAQGSATTAGTAGNNNILTGCTLIGGSRGYVIMGATTNLATGNKIINSTVKDFRLYGMLIQSTANFVASGNIIEQPNTTAAQTTVDAIFLNGGNGISGLLPSSNVLIEKNIIRKLFNAVPASTNGATGINCSISGTAGAETKIYNNLIYDIKGIGTVTGINMGTTNYVKVYNNTISLDNTAAVGGLTATSGITHTGTTTTGPADIRSNIISISRGGLGAKFCLTYNATVGARISNNNVLNITPSLANNIATNGAAYATLAAWKAANTLMYDQNSYDVNPLYSDPALDNYKANNILINNKGATGLSVTTDFAGVTRGATPDPGAYEFDVTTPDASLAWLSPSGAQTAGTKSISVNVTNVGAGTITSVVLTYDDGITGITETFTGLNIASGATVPLTFATPYSLTSSVSMIVTIGDVNGMQEAYLPNNTVVQYFCLGLGGTYTIDQSNSTSGTNFSSFKEAVTALGCGIFGPVVFNVVNSGFPFNENIEITPIPGSSATNTVTFNGNGTTISFSTDVLKPSTVMLYGADNLVFNNLTMESTSAGASAQAFACHLWNGADNNKFNKCTFKVPLTGTSTATSAAFSISGSDVSATTGPTTGVTGINNILDSCTVIGGANGISLYGPTTAGFASVGNHVRNCLIQDFHSGGISISYQNGSILRNNIVERPTKTTSGQAYGIFVQSGCLNVVTDKNVIKNLFAAFPLNTNQGNGIASNSTVASVGNENIFTNNLIYGITGNGSIYGFYLLSATYVKVYHNTIVLNDQASAQALTTPTYGIYASGATAIDIRNNNVSVTRAGLGPKFCLYFTTNSPSSNYNNLHLAAPTGTNFIAFNGTNYTTLAAWQAGSSKDANSVAENPQFVNAAANNFRPTSAAMDNKATPLGITTDFAGVTRNVATPDLGAYEFDATDSDASITWAAPVGAITAGSKTIGINVTNVGLSSIASLVMSYSDGVNTPVSQTFTGLNIASGATQLVSFTTPYNLTANVSITVVQSKVNGVNDPTLANSTIVKNVCLALAGTYTIDKGAPTAGTNFNSFAAAIAAMSCGGIATPVIFNVLASSGPYTEQVEFFEVLGASANNRITINGNMNLLIANATNTNYSTLLFSGGDYFTINDLMVESDAMACHLWNSSNYNEFNNCNFKSPTNATYSAIGSNTSDAAFSTSFRKNDAFYSVGGVSAASYTKVNNCTMTGGYGVCMISSTSTNGDTGNEITNCTMTDGYVYGAYSVYQTGFKLIGCTIEKPNRPATHAFQGIYVYNNLSGTFEKNIIRNAYGAGNSNSTSATYGINCLGSGGPGAENKFINNLIYGLNSGANYVYGILLDQSSNDNIVYHNTVVLDFAGSTGGGGVGIFALGNSGLKVKNNNIYITRGGTGTNYGLQYGYATGVESDYNNVYVNSATGVNNYGRVGQTDYATLAAFKASNFNLLDQHSINVDPMFVSATDYTPTNLTMNNKGVKIASVLTDIVGISRKLVPDMGAYEFGSSNAILLAKVFLENVNASGLMSDYLPTLASFPLSDPYSVAAAFSGAFTHVQNGPTKTTTAAVLTANDGNSNDIVDWIYIELRDGVAGSTTPAYTQAALLQRDGDIVSAENGTSEVEFPNAIAGDYYVAIRHRNHLGFRTMNKIAISSNTAALNFTNNSVPLNGLTPTITVGTLKAMSGGDANSDGSLDGIDSTIWEAQNGGFDNYFDNADYNLDGSVDGIDSGIWQTNNGRYQELD